MVKWTERIGGSILRDNGQAQKPVVEVDFTKTEVWDQDLKDLAELKQLRSLNLYHCLKVRGEGLKDLKELKE